MGKMDPTIKARWVAALRSGDYDQGHGRLHSKDANGISSFCCLGVLCDLANKENIVSEIMEYPSLNTVAVIYDDDESWLPTSVAEWSGVDHQGTFVETKHNHEFSTLAELNDSGATFAHLATIIEDYL